MREMKTPTDDLLDWVQFLNDPDVLITAGKATVAFSDVSVPDTKLIQFYRMRDGKALKG
jgi:hypothetical protein